MKLYNTNLTKRTFLLWAGLILAAVGSYLFYFIMARMLSVEDYGLLYSLIALTYLFTIPHETIRTVMSKYTMHLWIKKQKGKIKSLMFRTIKYLFLISIIIFIIFLLFLPLWMKIWHTSAWPLIIIGLTMLVAFILPVVWGILQGTNRFGNLGINHSVEMIIKLTIAIVLVALGFGIGGALIAIPLSMAAVFFVGFIPLKDIVKAKKEPFKLEKHVLRYSMSALIIFIFFVALYSVDIIIARYFFTPLYAGLYSAVSVIGKVLIFASTAITRVMFSEIVEKYGKKKKTKKSRQKSKKVLYKAMIFLAVLIGIFLFIAFIFPELVINIVVGNKYIAAAPVLKYITLAMAFLSFSALIVFYNLSIDWHKKLTAKILGSALFLQLAFLLLFHSNLEQFIKVILGVNIVLFIALLITLKR